MKKCFALFLALIMVVGLLPMHAHAASCPDGNHDWSNGNGVCAVLECQAKCSHNWKSWKKPNCVNGGWESAKCTICGMTNGTYQNHASKPHSFSGGVCSECGAVEVNPETCEHNWNQGTTCTKCGTTHTHNSDKQNIQPCGKSGAYNTKYCTVCNRRMEMVKTPSSHTFVGGVCTVCGAAEPAEECDEHTWNQTETCSVCGATHTHDKLDTHIQTCGTAGAYNDKNCSKCGKNMERTTTPASHSFVDGVCSVCGFEQPDEACEDHDWENGVCTVCGETCTHKEKTNYQNCVTGQYNTTVCEECGELLNTEPVPGEHTMNNGTCTVCGFKPCADGNHTYNTDGACTKCGAACPHKNTKTTHADCTGSGYVTTKCQDCGKLTEVKPVPGKHSFRNGICIACGAKDPDYDDVPKTGDNSMIIMASMTGVALLAAAAYVFDQKRKYC